MDRGFSFYNDLMELFGRRFANAFRRFQEVGPMQSWDSFRDPDDCIAKLRQADSLAALKQCLVGRGLVGTRYDGSDYEFEPILVLSFSAAEIGAKSREKLEDFAFPDRRGKRVAATKRRKTRVRRCQHCGRFAA